MEGIVVGIAQINFHQGLSGITNEIRPHFVKDSSTIMSVCGNSFSSSEESTNVCDQDVNNSVLTSLTEVDANGDSGWEEIEDDVEKNRQSRTGYTFVERRQMPTRASKESCLLGIKRRTIMKPTKRIKKHEDFQNLKPANIKKIYLNKKLTNFKPSCLETIFEEAPTFHIEENCSRVMGNRKVKRALSCSDGFRYSKTLVNKRRAKIKKNFGKRFALKKISLEEFITKLNASLEKNENIPNYDCQIKSDKSVTAKEHSYSEICASRSSVSLDEAMTSKNLPSTEFTNDLQINPYVTNYENLQD